MPKSTAHPGRKTTADKAPVSGKTKRDAVAVLPRAKGVKTRGGEPGDKAPAKGRLNKGVNKQGVTKDPKQKAVNKQRVIKGDLTAPKKGVAVDTLAPDVPRDVAVGSRKRRRGKKDKCGTAVSAPETQSANSGEDLGASADKKKRRNAGDIRAEATRENRAGESSAWSDDSMTKEMRDRDYVDENYAIRSDPHRHTCIFIRHLKRKVEFIPMDSSGLMVSRWEAERFYSEYNLKLQYSIVKAAELYKSAGKRLGSCEAVEAHLDFILNNLKGNDSMETQTTAVAGKGKVKTTKPSKGKPTGVKTPSAAKVEAGKKLAAKRNAARGPNPDDSKSIKLLVKENPKREGSTAHKKYELYRKYKKVADLLEHGAKLGYKRSTLKYDLKHKFISLS